MLLFLGFGERLGGSRRCINNDHVSYCATNVEKPRQLPQSAFGKAINYTLERWWSMEGSE